MGNRSIFSIGDCRFIWSGTPLAVEGRGSGSEGREEVACQELAVDLCTSSLSSVGISFHSVPPSKYGHVAMYVHKCAQWNQEMLKMRTHQLTGYYPHLSQFGIPIWETLLGQWKARACVSEQVIYIYSKQHVAALMRVCLTFFMSKLFPCNTIMYEHTVR